MSSGNFISPTYYFAGVLSHSPSPTKAAWEGGDVKGGEVPAAVVCSVEQRWRKRRREEVGKGEKKGREQKNDRRGDKRWR